VDEADRDPAWAHRATAPRPAAFARGEDESRAIAVAACRETLEEASVLPLAGGKMSHDEVVALRSRIARKEGTLLAGLAERGLMMDLSALHPLTRWVTPIAETRRFDTRFFLAVAPQGQHGAHDERETTASFWATPRQILDRFDGGDLQLFPPTHRTLEVLLAATTLDDALRIADEANKDPICPELVRHVEAGLETMALVLPGDPEHPIQAPRIAGTSRFVLRGARWLPGSPP
jgi:hypothetical protein